MNTVKTLQTIIIQKIWDIVENIANYDIIERKGDYYIIDLNYSYNGYKLYLKCSIDNCNIVAIHSKDIDNIVLSPYLYTGLDIKDLYPLWYKPIKQEYNKRLSDSKKYLIDKLLNSPKFLL